jgi:branched-chain amino acid transport system ATP-binding protein
MAMTEPLLVVEGLDAFYGQAQALEGVSFSMGRECVGVVGRNGMGKTTLCQAVVGLAPPRVSGSVRYRDQELTGHSPQRIARAGISYVPQGRRLFPSLTVEEHLRIARRKRRILHHDNRNRSWAVERVYDLFPQLAERRRHGAGALSGGEQQMLAIGRALMTNPDLLVMDEPSEGLAPTVIQSIVEAFQRMARETLAILLVEQNLGVACAMADRLLVMIAGRIAAETTADALAGDPEAQRRYLGVETIVH